MKLSTFWGLENPKIFLCTFKHFLSTRANPVNLGTPKDDAAAIVTVNFITKQEADPEVLTFVVSTAH